MKKTPEEIKNFETKKELAYIAFGKVTYEGCHKIAAKALAYIQRLEIQNGAIEKGLDEALVLNDKQASIIRSLNSNNSQVQKALQDNGFQTFEELLQAYSQVKREAGHEWISAKEQMPTGEDPVLILVKETEHYGLHKEKKKVYYCQYMAYWDGDEWFTTWCNGCRKISDTAKEPYADDYEVTHWMPLPEPPKEE